VTGLLQNSIEVEPGRYLVGYCCLGRACEVAIKHGIALESDGLAYRDPASTDDGVVTCDLPFVVQMWLGVSSPDPIVSDDTTAVRQACLRQLGIDIELEPILGAAEGVTASTANDVLGRSFPEIGDMLERLYLPEDAAS
jgi:hypothetical protein